MCVFKSEEEMVSFGERLGRHLFSGAVVTLEGDLGAGKTTFTKGIGSGLGVQKIINSPTFTIVKTYQGRYPLYHFDAYRLEGQNEELGFEEMFEDDGVCVIEWAQFIKDILPIERLDICIVKNDDGSRTMTFSPHGEIYQRLIEELRLC